MNLTESSLPVLYFIEILEMNEMKPTDFFEKLNDESSFTQTKGWDEKESMVNKTTCWEQRSREIKNLTIEQTYKYTVSLSFINGA